MQDIHGLYPVEPIRGEKDKSRWLSRTGVMEMSKQRIFLAVIFLITLVSFVNADYLQVFNATGPSLTLAGSTNVGANIALMTKETGDIAGTGHQYVVLHDGAELRAYSYASGSLSNDYSRPSETPQFLATGGDMNADGRDDIVWFDKSASTTCRAYTVAPNGSGGYWLSPFAARSNVADAVQMGLGEVSSYSSGDEFNLYDAYGAGYFVGLAELSNGKFTGAIYSQRAVWENSNLIDLQHINMKSGYGFENFMCSFSSDGTQLIVWQGASGAVLGSVSVNPGAADEALFLQVGNVNAYQNAGPEEAVLYRKDGSVIAYDAKTSGGFTASALGNIGTGVTDLLVGDVAGDDLEELIVAKGNAIEVYSLASGSPVLLSSGTVGGLVDMSIGDLDGDGKGDIIVGATVPEPLTITLLAMGGLAAIYRKRHS